MSDTTRTSGSPVPAVIASTAAGLIVLSVCLLVAGSFTDHIWLLAWGGVVGVLAIALGSLAAIRAMIDHAVDRCVQQVSTAVHGEVDAAVSATAVKVGEAIAEELRDHDPLPAPRAGVRSLY